MARGRGGFAGGWLSELGLSSFEDAGISRGLAVCCETLRSDVLLG